MAEQGAPNDTNKQGHDETNKIASEGEVNTSSGPTTSGGAAELSGLDRDPDVQPELNLGADPQGAQGGPSMTTRVSDPGEHPVEESSFAPGGDKVSEPRVKAEDLLDVTGGREEKPSDFHGAPPQR
jgi:hypothetical protein